MMEKEEKNNKNDSDEKRKFLEEFDKEESPEQAKQPEEKPETKNTEEDILVLIDGDQGSPAPPAGAEKPAQAEAETPSEEEAQEVSAAEKESVLEEAEKELQKPKRNLVAILINMSAIRRISSVLILLVGLYWCFIGAYSQNLHMLVFAFILIFAGLFYFNVSFLKGSEGNEVKGE